MSIEFGDIIAILALIISLINLIIYFINNKKKIEINLNTYRFTKLPKGYFYIFNVQIVNKSRTPIAIKGINCNGSDNPPIPYLVKENTKRSGKEVLSYEKYMTMEFPVNLNSLEGKSGYLEFKSDVELKLEDLMFSIYTNRGTIENLKIKGNSYNLSINIGIYKVQKEDKNISEIMDRAIIAHSASKGDVFD